MAVAALSAERSKDPSTQVQHCEHGGEIKIYFLNQNLFLKY